MSDFFARPEAGFLIAVLLVYFLAMFLVSRVLQALVARVINRAPKEPAVVPASGDAHVIVDGSNVLYWRGGEPRLETLIEVLAKLYSKGLSPGVMFDANAGYLVSEKYMHDGAFAKHLGVPEDSVLVVPKGTPADKTILLAARDMDARVVTNDQFRDWAEEYPEVEKEGFLIKGGYRKGKLWLDVAPPKTGASSK